LVTPGGRLDATTTADQPALLVALTAGLLKPGLGGELALEPGSVHWLPAGLASSFDNSGASAVELLRFDLKTRPAATP
jgi:hypothetical protein